MWGHLSPVMEGFSNPTMDSVFREMLKTPTSATAKTLTYVQGGDIRTYNNNSQIVVLNDNLFPAHPAGIGYKITGTTVQPNTTVTNYRFGKSNPSSVYDVIFIDLSKPVTSVDGDQTFYYVNPGDANLNIPNIQTRVEFLKSLVQQQKDIADSLMRTSKKLGPISQSKVNKEDAYDAAFETSVNAPLPMATGTLQGFTLIFFIISFLCLAVVFSININIISNNTSYAIFTFISFIALFIVSIGLIIRLG
jgi:hypothetical protein